MPSHPERYRSLIMEGQRLHSESLQAAEELREALRGVGLSPVLLDRLDLVELFEVHSALMAANRPPAPELPLDPQDVLVLQVVLATSQAAPHLIHMASDAIEVIRSLVPGATTTMETQHYPAPPGHRSGETPAVA